MALVEREAVTSPLDHAFGFELAEAIRESFATVASRNIRKLSRMLSPMRSKSMSVSRGGALAPRSGQRSSCHCVAWLDVGAGIGAPEQKDRPKAVCIFCYFVPDLDGRPEYA